MTEFEYNERMNELKYALAKQVNTANSVSTDYGDIQLNYDMKVHLGSALVDIILSEMNRLELEYKGVLKY